MNKTLMTVRGQPVILNKNGVIEFISGMTIDADGGYRTYAPKDSGLSPLDYLENAGHPGNWYGIVTVDGVPVVQGKDDPCPGYYVSPTTYQNKGFKITNPRRYLDSENVAFVVVPGPLRKLVQPVIIGCRATITNIRNGITIEAVVGDVGPATHLGEASMKAAELLGVNSNPKVGGSNNRVFKYMIYPGVAAEGYELQPI